MWVMSLTQSELEYIIDVLGVPHVLLPEASAPTLAPKSSKRRRVETAGSLQAPLVILLENRPSDSENAILQKMLEAMKVSSFYGLFDPELDASPSDLEDVLREASSKVGVIFGTTVTERGQWVDRGGVRWIKTYSLTSLVTQDSQLTQRKRETWGHLKQVMKEMVRG